MSTDERNKSEMQGLMDAQRREKQRDAEYPEKYRIMRGFLLESGVAIVDAFPNYGVAPDGSSWGDHPIRILSGFVKTINASKHRPRVIKQNPPELFSDRRAIIDAEKRESQRSKTEKFIRSTFRYANKVHISAPRTPFYRDPKSKLWCVRLLSKRDIHGDYNMAGRFNYTGDSKTFIDVFEDGTLRDPSFLRADQLPALENWETSNPQYPHATHTKRYGSVGHRIQLTTLEESIPLVLDELGIDRWVD